VHNPSTRQLAQARQVPEQAIEQSSARVASSRVHNQTAGLIEHQEVWVFISNVELHRLRKPVALWLGLRRLHPHDLVKPEGLAGTNSPIIDTDTALLDPELKPRARLVRMARRQHAVQALTRRTCIDPEDLWLAIIGALVP
jgi:hypothetical protein